MLREFNGSLRSGLYLGKCESLAEELPWVISNRPDLVPSMAYVLARAQVLDTSLLIEYIYSKPNLIGNPSGITNVSWSLGTSQCTDREAFNVVAKLALDSDLGSWSISRQTQFLWAFGYARVRHTKIFSVVRDSLLANEFQGATAHQIAMLALAFAQTRKLQVPLAIQMQKSALLILDEFESRSLANLLYGGLLARALQPEFVEAALKHAATLDYIGVVDGNTFKTVMKSSGIVNDQLSSRIAENKS